MCFQHRDIEAPSFSDFRIFFYPSARLLWSNPWRQNMFSSGRLESGRRLCNNLCDRHQMQRIFLGLRCGGPLTLAAMLSACRENFHPASLRHPRLNTLISAAGSKLRSSKLCALPKDTRFHCSWTGPLWALAQLWERLLEIVSVSFSLSAYLQMLRDSV